VLGAVFSTIGRYWQQIYGLVLCLVGGAALVSAAVGGIAVAVIWDTVDDVMSASDRFSGGSYSPSGGQLTTLIVTGVVVLLILAVVWLYVFSALHAVHAVVVSRAVTGTPLTAGELWRTARPRVGAVMGVELLVGLMTAGPVLVAVGGVVGMFVAAIPAGGASPDGGLIALAVIGSLVLFLAATVGVTYLSVRLLFAPSAATLEGQSAGAALSRSGTLIRGAWWRTLGITLIIGFAVSVVQQIIQYPISIFASTGMSASIAAGHDAPGPGSVIGWMCLMMLAPVLGTLISTPFTYVTNSLLYVDMRIRREGFDLTLGQAAGLPPHRAEAY